MAETRKGRRILKAIGNAALMFAVLFWGTLFLLGLISVMHYAFGGN